MNKRWLNRTAIPVVLSVVVYVVLRVLGFQPQPVALFLIAAVFAATTWLVSDVLVELGPAWTVRRDPPTEAATGDARLTTTVRVLEHHVRGREPGTALRDRLARLADSRLARHHGLRRDDAAARDLLGRDLLAVLDGPPRRLSLDEIDRHIRRIEEL